MKEPIIPGNNGLSHLSHYGTWFICDRCDLDAPIRVYERPEGDAPFATDVAEFAAFHRGSIHPHLNGFRGYDCLRFEFCEGEPTEVEKTGLSA